MEKPKGSVYISIGTMGMVVLAAIGILASPFIMVLSSWVGKVIRGLEMSGPMHRQSDMPMMGAFVGQFIALFKDTSLVVIIGIFVGGIIPMIGVAIGIILLILSAIQMTFGILAWKRRDDLTRTTFLLAVGIAFAIVSLPAGLTAWGLIQLAFPVLIIVGASLNKQEEQKWRAAYYASQPPAVDVPQETPTEELTETPTTESA